MPLGPAKPALTKAADVCEAHHEFQQFGQGHDGSAWNGRTACTHTICQTLAMIWLNRRLTIDQVNTIAGMPYRPVAANGQARGMNNLEFQRFCDRVGLPYVVRFGLPFETLLRYSNYGPVFYGMKYGSAPEMRGYTYRGRKSQPPFALVNGATQLQGFEVGRHAVLLLGYRSVVDSHGKVTAYRAWRKEPNHGSASRPEKPPYDIILTTQAKTEYNDYLKAGASRTYCALPTRSLV